MLVSRREMFYLLTLFYLLTPWLLVRPVVNFSIQAIASLFLLQNRFFGPHTAKSQPIWIKFYTHLLFYGIHLWADLDRDRRVGTLSPI